MGRSGLSPPGQMGTLPEGRWGVLSLVPSAESYFGLGVGSVRANPPLENTFVWEAFPLMSGSGSKPF